MQDYNKPIRIFYAILLRAGVTLHVEDGKLRVRGKTNVLSPAYRDEILKRKELLIEMLSPQPPAELAPYFYRMLTVDELESALNLAVGMQMDVDEVPVNGGWLLFMKNGDPPPASEPDPEAVPSSPIGSHVGPDITIGWDDGYLEFGEGEQTGMVYVEIKTDFGSVLFELQRPIQETYRSVNWQADPGTTYPCLGQITMSDHEDIKAYQIVYDGSDLLLVHMAMER